jgi:CubicO group peptidase (beta-lactamase class C family)
MKRKNVAWLLCVILATLSLTQTKAESQIPRDTQTIPDARVEQIEAAIAGWMTQTKAPALSIAIVTDNQLRWSKGYGLADVENSVPATADTAYRLASISKSITAVAIMQLVERGKLDLNASINKYCPAYPEKHSLQDAPDKTFSITLRQLLVHHSGVRHNRVDEILTTRHYNSVSEAIASFKDHPLVVEPETKYSYSTPGYTLLGCAIETASGRSYIDYLRENIFKPAGMNRTLVDDVYAMIPNRARGYRKTQAGVIQNAPLHDTSIKVPGGGLVSTVQDLAKFAIALNTNKLVKPETLAQMWTKPKTRDGKEQTYAMGFLVNERDGLLSVNNDGGQAGTRTYLFLIPKQNVAVALMTNLERAYCEVLVPKILDLLGEK